MASGFEMRVGDAEREATAAELREHYATGRLTLEELNDRIDRVFAAKTRGDLDALMRDLPSARPGGAGHALGGPGSAWTPGPGTGPGSGWTGPGAGPGAGWTGPGAGPGAGWGGPGAWGAGPVRRTFGTILTMGILICAIAVVGGFGVFGIGTGRPFGFALLVLAFGLLRRLIFGRGRGGGCGPRRRRR